MFRQPFNLQAGVKIAPFPSVVLGLALLWYRPLSLVNVLVVVVGCAISVVAGFLRGGIALAYVTTRPQRAPHPPRGRALAGSL